MQFTRRVVDQRRLSSGFCPNSLDILSVESVGMKRKDWPILGQKSLFPHWPALHHLFCYHLYWCGNTWKEHLSFMFVPVLLWSGIYSRSCTSTQVMNVSPSGLAWEAFWKDTLIAPRVASEASKVLMMSSWMSEMPSGLPLVHPDPILVVELGGTSMSSAWVRHRLSLTGKEKLW